MGAREFSFDDRCGRRSTSLSQTHCTTCCETFSGVNAFDLHRTLLPKSRGGDGVDRECTPPGSLRRKDGLPVLFADPTVFGPVWRRFDVRDKLPANWAGPSALRRKGREAA